MDAYRIVGGKSLEGVIEIGGAKNAALPILCATLVEKGTYILKNVPALKVIDALSTIVKVDSKLILEKIRYMVDNNYTVFVTVATYEYAGYMPGSSYPTYTIKSVEYHYE